MAFERGKMSITKSIFSQKIKGILRHKVYLLLLQGLMKSLRKRIRSSGYQVAGIRVAGDQAAAT